SDDTIDLSRGVIPIRIEQWDKDDGILDGDDDQCTISMVGKEIDLTLDLGSCQIDGELMGTCGQTLIVNDVPRAVFFEFNITVEPVATAPGLNVRCLHTPIWPQPGEAVTIKAEALNGTLAPRLVPSLQIWVNDRTTPMQVVNGSTVTVTVPGSTATPPPPGPVISGDHFNYACGIVDGPTEIWTGWRTVSVGTPSIASQYNGRVPIMYTNFRNSRLDFVFYAEARSYRTISSEFLRDVETAIREAYFGRDSVYFENQDKINFWISPELTESYGALEGTFGADCVNNSSDVDNPGWEDASVILHKWVDDPTTPQFEFRNCAEPDTRFLSSNVSPNNAVRGPATLRHEVGHVPFGLADEYVGGGHFQSDPFPNIYIERAPGAVPSEYITCAEDAPNVGKTDADCRSFIEPGGSWFGLGDGTWWTSDPGTNDLMCDEGIPQPLDSRRFSWLFDECEDSSC
ncbi:MAG TPA: hypothetical protein VGK83_02165, partial [Acidimicrobiia bacterium]